MRLHRLSITIVALALCTLTSAPAADRDPFPNTKPDVTLELVSEADAVAPGETVTVAVRFTHAPGWHTYWKNPGTVGMAPTLTWKLPAGYAAGPVRWQQPDLSKMGVYTVWGYEREALLLTDIAVPADAQAGADESVTLAVNVFYMACATNCCPDEAQLTLTLPVRQEAQRVEPWAAKFDAVRAQQPRALDGWRASATRAGDTYTLTLTPTVDASVNRDVRRAYFFNDDRLVSSAEPQQFKRDGDALVLTMKAEVHTPGSHPRLRGHVYAPTGFDADGAVTALAIDVPIVEAAD